MGTKNNAMDLRSSCIAILTVGKNIGPQIAKVVAHFVEKLLRGNRVSAAYLQRELHIGESAGEGRRQPAC